MPPGKRRALDALRNINKALTKKQPRLGLSRRLLKDVHAAFGGKLQAIIVGGAFTEPQTLQFFYDLGIPVANGYGLTEAGTAVTVNDLKPFRADTVGKPLPGMEVRIVNPDAEGIGQVCVHSKTVMAGYLNDPEMTAQTIVDGWLQTGDMGRFDRTGHLQLFGRRKNMIVTEEGEKRLRRRCGKRLRRLAGEGVLRIRGELHLAEPVDGGREIAADTESWAGANVFRRTEERDHCAK